ncbi:MAG: amidohydrolase family protein [Planctomycetota bacterium]
MRSLHSRPTPSARAPRRSCAIVLAAALTGSLWTGTAAGNATAAAHVDDHDAEESTPLVISAKRVIVRPGKVLENAKVVIEDGEIVAVGTDVKVPDGAQQLEGAVVCAGFHDAWSIAGVEGRAAAADRANSAALAVDALDPYGQETTLQELVEAGVLHARTVIGSGSALGGIGAVIRAHAAEPLLDDAAMSARLGLVRGGGSFVQVQNPDGSFTFRQEAPRLDPVERIGQIDKLVSELQSGEKYARDVAKYEADLAEWNESIADKEKELEEDFKKAKKARDKKVKDADEKGKEFKEKSYKEDKRPRAPKFDAEKAALARVAEGEIPLVVHAERAVEIRELLRLTESLSRLRLVVAGGTSSLACADALAERGVPVIVAPRPSDAGGPVGELDPGLSLAAELHERGVEVLIGSGGRSARASRDLPHLAALAVGHGLDPDAALRAITLGPARVFDVAGHVGSVQRGRKADLLVLSGDPLSSSTRVLAAISGGEVVHTAGE